MAEVIYQNGDNLLFLNRGQGIFIHNKDDIYWRRSRNEQFPEQYIIQKLIKYFQDKPHRNFIDVGSNIGAYPLQLCPFFDHAYAFEPCRESMYKLGMNLVLYNLLDYTDVYGDLLGDKVEDLLYNGFNAGLEGHIPEDYTNAKTITTKTLDSYNFQDIDFIKVDVEGMEEKVLRGAEETIKNNNYPPILFENWDPEIQNGANLTTEELQNKRDSLFNYLKSLGYEILLNWGDFETHLAIKNKHI